MIILYSGRRGAGKTTTLIKDAYNFYCNGWEIVTNMNSLKFPCTVLRNEEILDLINDETVTEVVLVIDEIQTFIDSRRSMRKQNVTFTYFIQQIRKRNIPILATTQYVRRVDIAFREHVDVLARPQFKEEYPVIICSYFDLTAIEDMYSVESTTKSEAVVIFDPRQVFPLFDTEEVIMPLKTKKEES